VRRYDAMCSLARATRWCDLCGVVVVVVALTAAVFSFREIESNNARVKVDFKGGPEMIGLIDRGLTDLFNDLPPDAFAAGKAVFDACDLSVDAAEEADLECRIIRAVAQNKRPSGGQS